MGFYKLVARNKKLKQWSNELRVLFGVRFIRAFQKLLIR